MHIQTACSCDHSSFVLDLSKALVLAEWGSNRNCDVLNTVAQNMVHVIGRPSGPSHG